MGHAQQNDQAQIARMLAQLKGEWLDGAPVERTLEIRQPQIQLETRKGWINSFCLVIKRNGLWVMLLPRFYQTLMGKGFGIAGITLCYRMPGLLRFSIVTTCFQCESVRSARLRKCCRGNYRSQ